MPGMLYYNWIIQFLNENNDLGIAGKIIHDDPDFPRDISQYEKFRIYVKENYLHLELRLIRIIRSSYRVYDRNIQA